MTLVEARVRQELLETSDEAIEDAVKYTDPMVLRGLIYQLTGDESIPAIGTPATKDGFFGFDLVELSNEDDIARIQAKAAEFLKAYRDAGAGELGIGPAERLPRSLSLTVGEELLEEELGLWLEELALDPWARGLDWQQPPLPERLESFPVVVIGAGMGGLNAAVQLKAAGIPFTLIEKNSGVGGTWFENRYPGARVDSPSCCYTHIFGVDFGYPNPFCERDENQRYFDWIADNFDLRDDIVFNTEVKSIVWDEESSTWTITAESAEGRPVWHARAVINAVGFLSRPSLPEIEGMVEFQGPSFHTARWPDNFDLEGKRVAVIGTGCSGYQLVPEIALQADQVYVFQRTPQWLFAIPGYRSPFPPQVTWLDRNLPYHTNFMRLRMTYPVASQVFARVTETDPDFDDPHALSALNKRMRDSCIGFLERKLADRPELLEKMIPPHPVWSARPVLVDEEYSIVDALLRDNVTLVTDGIRRIGPSGVEAQDDTDYEVDVIVYATGFQANDYLWPMEVRGRNDTTIEELWAKDGPRAYLTAMLPGFPNFFIVYGPNTNGALQVASFHELVTLFALQCIERLILDDKQCVEVTEDAYWRYNELVDARNERKHWNDPRAHNYYRNKYGRSSTQCPFRGTEMWHFLRRPDFEEVIVR